MKDILGNIFVISVIIFILAGAFAAIRLPEVLKGGIEVRMEEINIRINLLEDDVVKEQKINKDRYSSLARRIDSVNLLINKRTKPVKPRYNFMSM